MTEDDKRDLMAATIMAGLIQQPYGRTESLRRINLDEAYRRADEMLEHARESRTYEPSNKPRYRKGITPSGLNTKEKDE